MNKSETDAYLFLRKNELFSKYTDEELLEIAQITRAINLNPHDFLIHEDDIATEFYILANGNLEVLKKGTDKINHVIATLQPGEIVGEMSLFDDELRSTSVKAKDACKLFAISYSALNQLIQKNKNLYTILEGIIKKNTFRLRETTDKTVIALEQQIKEYKKRVSMANFIITTIVFLCFYIVVQNKLAQIISSGASTTELAIIMLTVFLIFLFLVLKTSNLTLAQCGFNLYHWKRAIFESIVFTIPFLAFLVLLKYVLIEAHIPFVGTKLFDPYLQFRKFTAEDELLEDWIYSAVIYCLFSVPLQEVICRGALQTAIYSFLDSPNKKWIAIVVSNIIFSSFHTAASFYLTLITFIPGLFWGWMFARQKTLLGVWLSHSIIGMWSLGVIGFWARGA
jgi:hypothetical protein